MTGTLNFLDHAVDPSTGTVSMRASFRNSMRLLLPGQFVRVRIEAGNNPNGITVPQRAVQMTTAGGSVMVVGAKNVPAARAVTLGRLVDGMWVVTNGLRPGETVIVDGLQQVRPGAPVKPVPVGARRAPTAQARGT